MTHISKARKSSVSITRERPSSRIEQERKIYKTIIESSTLFYEVPFKDHGVLNVRNIILLTPSKESVSVAWSQSETNSIIIDSNINLYQHSLTII